MSGADWFMLAMDPHMVKNKSVGNVCRFALFLNGRLDEHFLRKRLAEKNVFDWISRLTIKKGLPFQLPYWESGKINPIIQLHIHAHDTEEIPDSIFQRDILVTQSPLFQIDIINRPGFKSSFIFSWHHILMDGRGAGMLLRYLSGDIDFLDSSCLSPAESSRRSFVYNWNNMIKAKDFLKESSRKPLATFLEGKPSVQPNAHYRVYKFTHEETQTINENALKHGSRFGKSPYYLAITSRAAHQILIKRGQSEFPFWVPVPQDERLRGASGPLITNQLSFIFYRIPRKNLETIRGAVQIITSQMVGQIREQVPKKYATMMDWFRRMPLKPYYQLIKGPAGGSIASFLFSVAAESPNEFKKLFGLEVEDAINFPPNTYPPGLTVVFMHFHGCLKIIMTYIEESISSSEIILFEKMLIKDLLDGDPD